MTDFLYGWNTRPRDEGYYVAKNYSHINNAIAPEDKQNVERRRDIEDAKALKEMIGEVWD